MNGWMDVERRELCVGTYNICLRSDAMNQFLSNLVDVRHD